MAWKKILNFPNTGFGTFLLAFVFVLFFSFFLDTHNTFAVSDLSVSFTSGSSVSSSGTLLFPDCDLTCYQDYSYLIVEPSYSGFPSDFLSSPFYVRERSNSYLHSINFQYYYYAVYDISSFYELSFRGDWGTVDHDVSFTLSESLPSGDCPVCEECQTCPAVPDNPYDDKFDKIIVAIYTCGAIILVIYFFYCIYGMIIKSTGGK